MSIYKYEKPLANLPISMEPNCWTIDATVVDVSDGDTIVIISNVDPFKAKSTIRFIGVNAPETRPTIGIPQGINDYKIENAKKYAGKYGLTLDQAFQRGDDSKNLVKELINGSNNKVKITLSVDKWEGETPVYSRDSTASERYLGVVYTNGSNPININRTIINNGFGEVMYFNSGHVSVASWDPKTIIKKEENRQPIFREVESSYNEPEQFIQEGIDFNDNSIGVEYMENERLVNPPPGYLRIGDVEFVVPPQAITVTKQMSGKRINTLRSKGSIQTKSGYSDIAIQIELFFHNSEMINGIAVKGPDDSVFYINGLRPLLSQFKKTPFVPVFNEFLNGVHNIYAVSMVNITGQTVPGFPDCISVTMTMLKFEWKSFLSYTDDFRFAINWPLFRWYCQGPMRKSNDTSRTYLKPVNNKMSNMFSFKLANEQYLRNLNTDVQELSRMTTPLQFKTTDTSTTWGKVRHDGKALKNGINQKEQIESFRKSMGRDVVYVEEVFPGLSMQDMIYMDGNIYWKNLGLPQHLEGNVIPYYIVELQHQENINDAYDAGYMISSSRAKIPVSRVDLVDKIIGRYEDLEAGTDEKINEYNSMQDRINNAEENLQLDTIFIPDLHVQSITVGLENIISSFQVQESESPTHQYLGSQDGFIQVTLETTNNESLRRLVDVVRTAETYSREYRLGVVSGYLGVNNDIINIFGIEHVLVQNLNVNTVRGYPDRYEVSIIMTGFNKTQRRVENPNALKIGTEIEDKEDVKALGDSVEGIVEAKLLELEVYPDLELPTYTELLNFCDTAGIPYQAPPKRGKFVDPDFYVHTPDTLRKDIGEMLKREADESKKGGKNWKVTDFLGSAYIKPPLEGETLQSIKPLYEVSKEIADDATEKWKADLEKSQEFAANKQQASAIMQNNPTNGIVKNGNVSKSSANLANSDFTVSPATDTSINVDALKIFPTQEEWSRWQGNVNHMQNFLNIEYGGSSTAVVGSDLHGSAGINPEFSEMSAAIINEAKNLFGDTPLSVRINEAIGWCKALVHLELGWRQFKDDGSPDINRYLAVGMTQVRLRGGPHNFSLDSARRMAWDWKFNLYIGLSHYRNKCLEVYKFQGDPSWQNDVFRWGYMAYHDGSVNNGKTPLNKHSDVILLTKRYNEMFSGDINAVPNGKKVITSTESTKKKIRDGNTADKILGVSNPTEIVNNLAATTIDAVGPIEPTKEYSKYEPNIDLAKLWQDTFRDMLDTDQRGRLIRAFPGFQMFLIDEGRWISWVKMWDNFYGFNSIQSIDIVRSRKIAADTCVIRMTNVYDNLTRYEVDLDYGHYDDKYSWHELLFSRFDSQSLIDARKEYVNSLYLKTGARMHLRMGYSACAAELPVVFNGTITELEAGGDIIEIVAQGDGIELCNMIGGDPDRVNSGLMFSEPRSTLCYLMSRHNNIIWSWIEAQMTNKDPAAVAAVLAKLFDKPENPLGIAHFGNPYEFPNPTFTPWGAGEQLGEIAANIYTSTGKGTHSQWLFDKYSLGGQYDVNSQDIIDKPDGWHLAWGFMPWPDGDEPDVVVPLYSRTLWDVAQTLSLISPDYIAAVAPFEFRSTLFYGRPYWPMSYRYKWHYEWDSSKKLFKRNAIKLLQKPYSQTHIYLSYCDIISNGIRASEDGVVTNVIGTYKTGVNGSPKSTMIVHADTDIYPEKQKTAVVNLDIIEGNWLTETVVDNTARLANIASAQELRNMMKDMYKGDLIVIGDPSVKPHDTFYIVDNQNDMNGMAGVKQVVHHFSHETGFVTNICPDALIVVDDKLYLNLINWQASALTGIAAYGLGRMYAIAAWKRFTGSTLAESMSKGLNAVGKGALEALIKFAGDDEVTKAIATELSDIVDSRGWSAAMEYIKNPPATSGLSLLNDAEYMRGAEGRAGQILKAFQKAKDWYVGAEVAEAGAIRSGTSAAARTAIRGILGVGRVAMTSTGIGIIASLGLGILADRVFEAWSRRKRNMQAVIIIPLKSHGKPLTAGINGHQGCVVGDKPSKIDLWFEGKSDMAFNTIPKVMNALSGDHTTFSYSTVSDLPEYEEGYNVNHR